MPDKAVFRATVHRGCGEALDDDGNCSCSRARLAAKEVEPAAAADLTPPDPFAAAIAHKRAALGYPTATKTTRAGERHEFKVGARPVFPMKPNPAPDPFEAKIQALRKRRGIKPAHSLPDTYDGSPPDAYAAGIAAARAAQEVA